MHHQLATGIAGLQHPAKAFLGLLQLGVLQGRPVRARAWAAVCWPIMAWASPTQVGHQLCQRDTSSSGCSAGRGLAVCPVLAASLTASWKLPRRSIRPCSRACAPVHTRPLGHGVDLLGRGLAGGRGLGGEVAVDALDRRCTMAATRGSNGRRQSYARHPARWYGAAGVDRQLVHGLVGGGQMPNTPIGAGDRGGVGQHGVPTTSDPVTTGSGHVTHGHHHGLASLAGQFQLDGSARRQRLLPPGVHRSTTICLTFWSSRPLRISAEVDSPPMVLRGGITVLNLAFNDHGDPWSPKGRLGGSVAR